MDDAEPPIREACQLFAHLRESRALYFVKSENALFCSVLEFGEDRVPRRDIPRGRATARAVCLLQGAPENAQNP